eukprot:TRINITY_DN106789_c0_g1_i1.p1 TRINITY_DN106789_c0_g1~~TRINITY_DN106789_c0_g1_i1.p1  ORF type:complete len:514 (-),score=97.09 TRINITY_DN106789_c0_g1_i1:49-1590(-)
MVSALVWGLLLQPLVEGAQVKSVGGQIFTNNPICAKNRCTNPLTPGLNDLPRLSGLIWQCSATGDVQKYLKFCKAAVNYDSALPSPENKSQGLVALVEAQDSAASTMFFYHLAGLGMEAWDFQTESDIQANPCVKRVYELACYTYFPRNQGSCKSGDQIPYLKPCKNACQTYIDTCDVECCDESARCIFDITSDLGGGAVSKTSGYFDEDGPSALCTGSGSNRITAPVTWLLLLLSFHALASTGESRGSLQPRAEGCRGLGGVGKMVMLLAVLVGCGVSLQGCVLSIPVHQTANWLKKPDYLVKFEYVPPGKLATSAQLNSCSAGAAGREVCSGRGQCKTWSHLPLKLTDPDSSAVPGGVSFCECDPAWADPECRTRRKSQAKAFALSLFGGFLGLDLFYLGYIGQGALKLCTLGGGGAWWLFDIVRLGCAPVYAKYYRVQPDLPHWVFMLIILLIFGAGGLVYSLNSYVKFRRLKRDACSKLQGDELHLSMDARPEPNAWGGNFTGYGAVVG